MKVSQANNAYEYINFDVIFEIPFVHLGIELAEDNRSIKKVAYIPNHIALIEAQSKLAQEAQRQILAYLEDPTFRFSLPVQEKSGSEFQKKVWQAIDDIPLGQVLTYSQLAKGILCASPRPIGGACGANPMALLTPCHRVVAQNGIGGFGHTASGALIELKVWLLEHEGFLTN